VLGQRYHLITRDDRLDAVAKDIVHHFLNRGYQGKAMVVSIDKLTTLRMYEKVRAEWEAEKVRVLKALDGMAGGHPDHAGLLARLVNLQETDMAVVVSPGQNEISEMKEKGFDILPHRERWDLEAIPDSSNKRFIPAVNQLLRTDEVRDSFLGQANDVARLYKAVMPDPVIPLLVPRAQVIAELAKAVRAQKETVNITEVMGKISEVLDKSIVTEAQKTPGAEAKTIDLSKIDFDVLEKKFAKTPNKNIEAQQLRALIERKLDNLIRLNASRYDFLDRFQKMIEAYNSGALSIEQLFAELVTFTKDLNEEEQRHLRENISEEELAVFDILTRPGPDLTPVETEAIKKVCKDLLAKLKTEKLVLAWRTKRTTRAAVRVEIEKLLDSGLPEKYTTDLFETKCGALFQHVLEKYPESGESVYEAAG
jgi:type I site-specific restriction-modification system R (restriction) subunit